MRFLLITLKSQPELGPEKIKNLDQQHDALFTKPWTKIRWSFAGHWQTCASLSPSILSPDAIFSPPPSLCHPLPTKWDRLLAFSLLIKLYFFDHAGSLAHKVWIEQKLDCAENGSCRKWMLQKLDCAKIAAWCIVYETVDQN